MGLSIGIRLVIIFPTLLFLIGYILKAIIESKNQEKMEQDSVEIVMDMLKIMGKENSDEELKKSVELLKEVLVHWGERFLDFLFVFGIESIILFVANGLIIIFELQQSELGISSMIVGIILSLFLLVGIYSKTKLGLSASIFGYILAFGLLGVELAYFISFGTEKTIGSFPIEIVYLIVFIVCMAILGFTAYLIFPNLKGVLKEATTK